MAHLDPKTIKKNDKQINVTPFFSFLLMIPYRTFFKVRFVNIGFTEDIVNGPFLSFFYERGE